MYTTTSRVKNADLGQCRMWGGVLNECGAVYPVEITWWVLRRYFEQTYSRERMIVGVNSKQYPPGTQHVLVQERAGYLIIFRSIVSHRCSPILRSILYSCNGIPTFATLVLLLLLQVLRLRTAYDTTPDYTYRPLTAVLYFEVLLYSEVDCCCSHTAVQQQ